MSEETRTWVSIAILAVLVIGVGAYPGYRRYFTETDAEVRQAEALERIANALDRAFPPPSPISTLSSGEFLSGR